MTDFHLLRATTSHIDDIMNIEEACFIKEIREKREVFLERIKCENDAFYVFLDGQKVMGYISAERLEKIPETENEIALNHTPAGRGNNLYISSFGILPSYRGNGDGKKLWEMAMNEFSQIDGIKKIILLVNEDWKGALHIYEKSGFTVHKIFPAFFPQPSNSSTDKYRSDGILMVKENI